MIERPPYSFVWSTGLLRSPRILGRCSLGHPDRRPLHGCPAGRGLRSAQRGSRRAAGADHAEPRRGPAGPRRLTSRHGGSARPVRRGGPHGPGRAPDSPMHGSCGLAVGKPKRRMPAGSGGPDRLAVRYSPAVLSLSRKTSPPHTPAPSWGFPVREARQAAMIGHRRQMFCASRWRRARCAADSSRPSSSASQGLGYG